MAQDIREFFKEQYKKENVKMSQGHEARFLEKLDAELPKQKAKSHFNFLNVAASALLLLSLSYGVFKMMPSGNLPAQDTPTVVESTPKLKTLGDISPDLKKVEDYYLASIHLQLSKVQLTPQNKELFDGYIQRLKELDTEYNNLIQELNDNGPNEATLDALISNLKFRLNLVTRLQEKLKEFDADAFAQKNI
jgi:hypothetical protein